MYLHANAKLGLAGRLALVRAIEDGLFVEGGRGPLQRLAGDGASLVASLAGWRQSAGGVVDRSSRPRRSPRQLAPELQERICDCRRQTGWGPRLVAARPASRTRRSGRCFAGRALAAAAAAKEPANRYEWPCPGDLLHMDTSRYARFLRPGYRVTGDRSECSRRWSRPKRGSATTTRTWSSTTTRGSPTSSCTTTKSSDSHRLC